jgi:NADH-quinone oxidoreductase subunit A
MITKLMEMLLAPPLAFLFFLAVFYLIYFLAGRLAPKLSAVGGKLKSYHCGEDIPGSKPQFGYKLFFFIALFFTMMHVAALVVATLPSGPVAYLGLFYLGMIFLAVLALITRDQHD